jgi:hypothetical protein
VAEGGGLLNRYTLSRRIEGSNPSVSANAPSSDIQSSPKNIMQNRSLGRLSRLTAAILVC